MALLGFALVFSGCSPAGTTDKESATTRPTTAPALSGTASAADRRRAEATRDEITAMVRGLPTGLQGRRADLSLPGVRPTGSGNLPEVAGEWRLASFDVVNAVDKLTFAAKAKGPARSLSDILAAIAGCIEDVDPDFYISFVGDQCGTLVGQVEQRLAALSLALGTL